ncbi:excinuclease ABC subunit UvrA, partial [Candidatus Collierbacteria bacterium]|nr:excinuclease ABC subunit UvrA [Candidatus Collierbacteria bacterium]
SQLNLFKNNRHDIDAIIDKLVVQREKGGVNTNIDKSRLMESIEAAAKLTGGEVIASIVKDASLSFPDEPKELEDHLYSENLACPHCNISLPKLEPRNFSFNSPDGACPTCTGLGSKLTINRELLLAESLTLREGGIIPLASQFENETWMARLITKVMKDVGFDDKTSLEKMTDKQKDILFEGTGKTVHDVHGLNSQGRPTIWHTPFTGLVAEFERRYQETSSEYVRQELDQYMIKLACPDCAGNRLKPESIAVTVDGLSVAKVTSLAIDKVLQYIKELVTKLSSVELPIAEPIIKEIKDRLEFLESVGLSYLTLGRESGSLSGGELQRIRLASQIGSRLTGILYVLDEPT